MGLAPESSMASAAIEDFSGELLHEYDQSVLWGAPIIRWPGDFQPIEIVQAYANESTSLGSRCPGLDAGQLHQNLDDVISPWFRELSPDNAHAETIC
jgi:hypothetical protein